MQNPAATISAHYQNMKAIMSQDKSKIAASWEFFFSQVSKRRGYLPSSALLLSTSVLFVPILYMTAALSLLTDIGMGLWVLPTGLVLWATAVVGLHREEKWQRLAVTLLLFLTIFAVLAALLASYTLDTKYDSRTYHAIAILALLDGVNPYWHPDTWVSYTYPAAHWLVSTSLIFWTQSFEASFALTFVAAFAAFLCARHFFGLLGLNSIWRNLLAFLLAMNPITSLCFFGHYTDGLLASTLLSAFMLMLAFLVDDKMASRKARRRMAALVAVTLVLLINIKATGLVFGGILGLVTLAYGLRRRVQRKRIVRLAGLGCASAIVAVVLFGFFPYATNVAQGKNPFYPAIKFDAQGNISGVIDHRFDPTFYKKSSYSKWWISLFSTRDAKWPQVGNPLPPFSSSSPYSAMLGYGSLFSGSLLLCLTLVFFVRHSGAWLVLAGVMGSVLSAPAGFYTRLTPQTWWLPLFFLVFLLAPDDKKHPLSRAGMAVVFVVTACLLYVSVLRFDGYRKQSVHWAATVTKFEKQGGWFVIPYILTYNPHNTKAFFRYYTSGLSGVGLPSIEACPEGAERKRMFRGLALCRP